MLKKTLSWVMVGMLFLSLVFNENLVTKKIDAAEIKNEQHWWEIRTAGKPHFSTSLQVDTNTWATTAV